MTGGAEASYAINKNLARAAQAANIAVGTGSMRILLEQPASFGDFHLRPIAPDVPIFSNLGAQQLLAEKRRDGFKTLCELNKKLEVDAIAVHLNPGQELYQPNGERDFRGLKNVVADFIEQANLPVIIKETGFGIAPDEVDFLLQAGAAYVDVAGAGGTNWLLVEAQQPVANPLDDGESFRDWGWPTALLLAAVGHANGRILASGGVRTGLDVAKALALGAHSVGMALPLLRAVNTGGTDAVLTLLASIEQTLKTAMLLSGCVNAAALRNAPLDASANFEYRLNQVRLV